MKLYWKIQISQLWQLENQKEVVLAISGSAIMTNAEVAISVRADYKHKGVAWELLHHVAHFAAAKGIKSLQSIESRENHEAIELELKQGFVATAYPDDPTLLLISKDLSSSE